MLVVFNSFGLVWVIAAFAAAIGLQTAGIAVEKDGKYFLEAIVFAILALDLGYRVVIGKQRYKKTQGEAGGLKTNIGNHWLLGPSLGGNLMFLPAWATALLTYLWLKTILA